MKMLQTTALVVILFNHINIFVSAQNRRAFVCAGQSQFAGCQQTEQSIMVRSLTIYSTDQLGDVIINPSSCWGIPKCERNIVGVNDVGLDAGYRHLYETIQAFCGGKYSCTITAPNSTSLYGETSEDYINRFTSAGDKPECPAEPKLKPFVGMLLAYDCLLIESATFTHPPSTTPVTEATTPSSTESFAYVVPFYRSVLNDRERIILGIVIGLAIVILIVLLLILYCWDRLRNQKKFRKLLQKIGRPQANDDAYDETDFARKEHWMDETQDDGALGEYTGVKPDEFMTIDRKQLEESGQIISDSMFGTMTMGRSGANTASLARGNGYGGRPDVDPIAYAGPVDYETEENLELEQRMAAAMGGHDTNADITIEATTGM